MRQIENGPRIVLNMPPNTSRLHRHSLLSALSFIAIVNLGCGLSTQSDVERSAAELSVLDEIRQLSYVHLTTAVGQLDSVSYRESVEILELRDPVPIQRVISGSAELSDGDGPSLNDSTVVGMRRYVKTNAPGSGVQIDSAETTMDVSTESVVEKLNDEALTSNGPQLPFDLPPDFTSEKLAHKFSYSRSDTVIGGTSFMQYQISAIGQSAGSLPSTTLFVQAAAPRDVVRIIDRSHNAVFLFRADNATDLSIIPIGSSWLPSRFRVSMNLKAPLRKERHFIVDKKYSF